MYIKELIERGISYLKLKSTEVKIERASRNTNKNLKLWPSSLNLMMVDVCNSECIMCGCDYQNCGSAEFLTLNKIKKIYNHLIPGKLVEVIYGGGGEPFLNPELSEIAEYTKLTCPTVQHTVISNFISASADVLEVLLKNRVNFLISINASTKETYKKISGVDAYEKVCKNIHKLVDLRKKIKSLSGISVSIILMKQNIDELSNLVRLAHSIGVDSVKAVYVRIYPEKYRVKKNGRIHILPNDSLFFHQSKSNHEILSAAALAKKLGTSFSHQPLFGCDGKK
ncbi:hypothetical protein LCGC14_3049550, partial [marine sediment metagenome]